MSELDSVARIQRVFLRLVGMRGTESAFRDRGESDGEVVYELLTEASRAAQRFMLDNGYKGWQKRSSALSFSGSDETTGGQYVDLPSDHLTSHGNKKYSALVEADGTPWGTEIDEEDAGRVTGDFYYFRGDADSDQLWLARDATPPNALYLEYHAKHTAWSASVTIVFPLEARRLIPTMAAQIAMDEYWLPGGEEMEQRIERATVRAKDRARKVCRSSKQPLTLRKARRASSRY